jgi:MFS family permease
VFPQVIYEIGFSSIVYILTVLIADTSQMRNRVLVLGVWNIPYVTTTFTVAPMVQAFLDNSTWRWVYGTFSIVAPVIFLPVIFIL